MSPADPASPKRVASKGAHPAGRERGNENAQAAAKEGAEGAAGPADRDSEGVYYMSVEDFERRIEPEASDVEPEPEPESQRGAASRREERP